MSTDKDTTLPEFCLTSPSMSREEEQKAKACVRSKIWYHANKEHAKSQHKAYREANKEVIAAKSKAWHEAHKEVANARNKAWHEAHKEVANARNKAYREAHKEEDNARSRSYAQANKETACVRAKDWYEVNKERATVYHKAWHKANKGRKYGLTKAEYADMLQGCNGRCPCCKVPFSDILGTQPCVDHDHNLGYCREAVRGIICHRCNCLIGHANDNPRVLRAVSRYLDNHQRIKE